MSDSAEGPLVLRRVDDDRVVCSRVTHERSYWGRLRGLMGRSMLDPDEGLYLQDTGIHMLFMRFPIDACFVSAPDATGARRVVAVRRGLPPWRGFVLHIGGAQGVVELAAGTLERCGVAAGDAVTLAQSGARTA